MSNSVFASLFIAATACAGWVWRMAAWHEVLPLPVWLVGAFGTLLALRWWLVRRLNQANGRGSR